MEKMLGASQTKASMEAAQRSETYAADNVIDARYYHIGPGDVLSFLKMDAAATEETMVVSPENMVFVPRLGAISAVGMTLAQLRDSIVALQHARTPSIQLFIGLRKARQVYVTIRGSVLSPGVYTLPASLSVSTAIKLAMQIKQTISDPNALRQAAAIMGQPENSSPAASIRQRTSLLPASVARNIVVNHSDHSSELCDLQRAETMNSAVDDPYLREGDEIFVPNDLISAATMSIAGGVSQATTTVYKKGDKISFLLKLGGHCTNLAAPSRARLMRDGKETELTIDDQLNLQSADMDAQPGDLIIVDQDVPERNQRYGSVTISGEVVHPGVMPIEQNVTKVKEIIDKAGGCTPDASLNMAYVLRREKGVESVIQNDYIERLKKLQYSNLLMEDTVRFAIDEYARKPIVACNLAKAISNPDGQDNVVLQDGDYVVIPKNPNSVFVYGQVRSGGYFKYVSGKSLEQYVADAGGFTSNADRGRERVIKARTGVWLKAEETTIEAGDRIYVPHPPDEPLSQQVQKTASYVSIGVAIINVLFSMISVYLALKK